MNRREHLKVGLVTCFSVFFVILFFEFKRGISIPENSWTAALLFGAFCGALGPDFDLDLLGIKYHRSMLTHSALIPALVVYGYWFNYFGLAASGMFVIGYASHLFADLFPSHSGIKDLKSRETWSGARDQWRVNRRGYDVSEETERKILAKSCITGVASGEVKTQEKPAKRAASKVAKTPAAASGKKRHTMDAPGAVKPAKILHALHCPDGLWLFLNGLVCVVLTLWMYWSEYVWLMSP